MTPSKNLFCHVELYTNLFLKLSEQDDLNPYFMEKSRTATIRQLIDNSTDRKIICNYSDSLNKFQAKVMKKS